MIENFICNKCDHALVCRLENDLDPFLQENMKYNEIDIRMLNCKHFEPVKEYEQDGENNRK